MKALLKLNLTVHLQEPEAPSLSTFGDGTEKDGLVAKECSRRLYLSYPISTHVAGEREVTGMLEAAALMKLVEENVRKVFASLSIAQVEVPIVIEAPPSQDPEADTPMQPPSDA